jgi:hypothetical protein
MPLPVRFRAHAYRLLIVKEPSALRRLIKRCVDQCRRKSMTLFPFGVKQFLLELERLSASFCSDLCAAAPIRASTAKRQDYAARSTRRQARLPAFFAPAWIRPAG